MTIRLSPFRAHRITLQTDQWPLYPVLSLHPDLPLFPCQNCTHSCSTRHPVLTAPDTNSSSISLSHSEQSGFRKEEEVQVEDDEERASKKSFLGKSDLAFRLLLEGCFLKSLTRTDARRDIAPTSLQNGDMPSRRCRHGICIAGPPIMIKDIIMSLTMDM
jgi:hypothetical protein